MFNCLRYLWHNFCTNQNKYDTSVTNLLIMYHIPQDKRAQASAQKITNALEYLLDSNNFNQISVSQICDESGVSRTTFYRLFDIPADIIQWYCDSYSQKLWDALKQEDKMVLELPFQFNVRYIFNHPEALELAYKAGRLDIADAAFYNNVATMLYEMKHKYHLNEMDMKMSAAIVSSIITSAFKVWMNESKKGSIDMFYERIIRIVQHIR